MSNKILNISYMLIGIAILNMAYLFFNYADVFPTLDEWNFVPIKDFSVGFLFRFNNENMQFFTNGIFAIVEKAGLKWQANLFFETVVYLLMIYTLFRIISKDIKGWNKVLLVLLFLQFFSYYSLEVLLWTVLSQTWFYFLFMFLSVHYGFDYNVNEKKTVLAFVFIICDILAMNVSFAIMFTLLYILKCIYNAKTLQERKRAYMASAISFEVMLVVIACFWFMMRKGDSTSIDLSIIFNKDFYVWLGYLMFAPAFGLWLPVDNRIMILFVFICMICWMGVLFFRQIKDVKKQKIWALLLVVTGGCVALTLFRQEHVMSLLRYSSRYIIYGVVLSVLLYVVGAIDENVWVRRVNNVIGLIMLICMLANFFSFRFFETVNNNKKGEDCIKAYYALEKRPQEYYCMRKYWWNIASKLDDFEKIYMAR